MEANWIQFGLLLLTFVLFLLRNEHRITLVEEQLRSQRHVNSLIWGRIEKLEAEKK